MHADIVDILQDIVVPEAENSPAIRFKATGANLIIGLIALVGMLRAVYFNDKLFRRTGEINDVTGDGQLATEAETHEAVGAQFIPEA